ncbi:MAG: peptide ABC transporter substrate-binding protein [Anaerolineales bacterium]|nr:peptide ABC transporter substrate-binding protein [Chloroflexota bacterium]MBL6981024.1 peptide ABC transporter substrate-binding protein [Anaerolineales bacterium]
MKRLRWQLLIVFLALVAIGVLLVGQQPVTVQPLAPEPVTGGSYTEGLVGEFSRLNPILAFYNPADRDINRLLFDSLVLFDDRGLPQPVIAESWGISRDGTVYNFSLRTDATWHNGVPITSSDIIFTINFLKNPGSPIPEDLRAFWEEIEVIGLDEFTIQFRLPEPFAPFLDYLTFGILPAHLLNGQTPETLIADPFNLNPVGSGPYRFEQLIVEGGLITGVALTAFDDYYQGRPFIDQVIFRYYPDQTSALAAYRTGEIQGISQISSDILGEALKEPNLNFYTGRLPELSIILLNLDDNELPFFQDSDIRRALLTGINRQWMADHILNSQATIADGPIFPNTWAYYEGVSRINYDPDTALRMIKDAGYTIPAEGGVVRANEEGVFLSFTLIHPEGEPYTSLAQAIQQNWTALGVDISLQALPYDQLINNHLETRNYEAALVDLNLFQSPDPDPYPFWHQTQITGGQNYAMWDDRQASEYLEQARILVDPEERTRLYRNFQVRFAGELPALPLFYPMYTYGVDSQIKGVRIGPLFDTPDRFATVTDWFLFSERRGIEQSENSAP